MRFRPLLGARARPHVRGHLAPLLEQVHDHPLSLDTVHTPAGVTSRTLGGSGAYAAIACSRVAPTGLVSVVGDDLDDSHLELLRSVDLLGSRSVVGRAR